MIFRGKMKVDGDEFCHIEAFKLEVVYWCWCNTSLWNNLDDMLGLKAAGTVAH